jgi:lipid II:glycine glycyltransferase (peptidoglycan interpeptide bridge formation enzyme)
MSNPSEWEAFLADHPGAHLLQTAAWGELKSTYGWRPGWVRSEASGAQVLVHPLVGGLSFAYLPCGPIPATFDALRNLAPEMDRFCRSQRAVFLKVEPDFDDTPDRRDRLAGAGFVPSHQTVQPPRTILVDLRGTEDEILARMKQKTRYNIRLATRHDVTIVASEDTGIFSRMMEITGERDAFSIHAGDYYQRAFRLFSRTGNVRLLLALYGGTPIAGLMVFTRGPRAWYLFGASTDEHREVMGPYLLQWEAMRWARSRGCTEYDLWGIPDEEEDELEARFTSRGDGLWGVYRFKRGFGGRIRRSVGAWDRVYNRPVYSAYRLWDRLRRRSG